MSALFASRWKTSVLIVSKQQLVRIVVFLKIIALLYTVVASIIMKRNVFFLLYLICSEITFHLYNQFYIVVQTLFLCKIQDRYGILCKERQPVKTSSKCMNILINNIHELWHNNSSVLQEREGSIYMKKRKLFPIVHVLAEA